ncbi:MAG: cytochrome b/b6 domain-containing protein [Proteobacteria bacterium]|nr:cytochrome b/b6 domain-containing protein [Pseudomonadota bacterium]
MKKIYLYSRYERFWHWLQMVFIFILIVTGLEVNGLYSLLGFKRAVTIHTFTGLAWLVSFFFFVFWVLTTGEWRQYVPTSKKMLQVIRFYSFGIFKGEAHPVPKRKDAKHNPLQRLSYLILAAAMLPVQMLTGFLYWRYNVWNAWKLDFLDLETVAGIHIALTFAIVCFVIIHMYMTSTGHTLTAHVKAMVTGWEDVEDDQEVFDWEKQ